MADLILTLSIANLIGLTIGYAISKLALDWYCGIDSIDE